MPEPRIAGLLTPILEGLGLELEAVDVVPAGKRRLLRILVDGDGENGRGPTLDDIAEATKAISEALDDADVAGASPYTLEVSSRGVGRPLELPRHWRRNATRLVSLSTAGGEQVVGRIVSAGEESVVLTVAGARRELAFAEVTKAHVQVELNRSAADEPEPAEIEPAEIEEEED